MTIAGIDFSLTSPAITIHDNGEVTYHFLTSKKKLLGKFRKQTIIGSEYKEWKTQEDRYDILSEWALGVVKDCDRVRLEGYAFAAKGAAIFQIGEATGITKYKLWQNGIKFDTIAPPSVKKHATGSGRADKSMMYDAFYEKTNIDLLKVLDVNKKDMNPVSGIVDSYFICQSLLSKTGYPS